MGGFCAKRKKHRPNEALKSFINYILLISRKIQLDGRVAPRARVACVQSLYLNLNK